MTAPAWTADPVARTITDSQGYLVVRAGLSTDAEFAMLCAAPDLYEALRAIVAAPYGIALGDLERAQAALAKAEGGAR